MMYFIAAVWTGMAAMPAMAVEVGEQAPEFKMPATTGADIALSDYRGKKWVFLEFYGADFQPTWAANLSARRANFKSFEDLGVQILATSANLTFSQQTFAESLKLPFPLLSDFPERKTMRAYGVLNEKTMIAIRTFFLIDPQGVIRRKWVLANPATDVVYSDTILRGIREVMEKK
jgi:peroxiredoxin